MVRCAPGKACDQFRLRAYDAMIAEQALLTQSEAAIISAVEEDEIRGAGSVALPAFALRGERALGDEHVGSRRRAKAVDEMPDTIGAHQRPAINLDCADLTLRDKLPRLCESDAERLRGIVDGYRDRFHVITPKHV